MQAAVIRKCVILIVVLLLPGLADAGSMAAGRRLLVFGDSLSSAYGMAPEQGWVAALADRLGRRPQPWTVINTSLSGETTAGGLSRLGDVLDRYKPGVVILELGGNDGLRGLSLDRTRANLLRMIGLIRERRARVLLLGMRLPPNYGPVYTGKFRAIYEDLARELKLAYVPFFLQGVATDPALMQADGIHPRARAQARLLDNVWPPLARLVEAIAQ